MQGPRAHWLPDGKRLHLNHGPIDLIIEAFAARDEVERAYHQAVARFQTILPELVAELTLLRTAVKPALDRRYPAFGLPLLPNVSVSRADGQAPRYVPRAASPSGWSRGSADRSESPTQDTTSAPTADPRDKPWDDAAARPARVVFRPDEAAVESEDALPIPKIVHLTGPIARRMYAAVLPHAENFVTPMAAVAGSVADEIMAAMLVGRSLDKAYVNNGGDIALHVSAGEELRIAVAGTGISEPDRIAVCADDPVRGIATSGWRGRSFSLGIADAVSVLARSGAVADAAATIIANAVDLPGHPAISRQPANELAPDTDLGERPVTVAVGALSADEVTAALQRGRVVAEDMLARGLITASWLFLAGRCLMVERRLERIVSNFPSEPKEIAHA